MSARLRLQRRFEPAKIRKAAHTAALIAKGPASVMKTGFEEAQQHNLYPMLHAPNEMGLEERVALVKRADYRGSRLRFARVSGPSHLRRQPAQRASRHERRQT